MSKFLDVTLIIPTHNRVHYLESVLEYYINEKKMDAQIIICDSSSIKYDGSFLDKGNVVYNYWPTLTFPEKLVTALKSVSSKYVLVSPDDDYYALDNLEDLKEVLDTNQDVTSVDGKTVLFNNEMQVTPTGMYKKSLDEESVIERLTYGYANYFPTVYSLYRTEFICNIYEKMIKYKIESHGFFEYTFFALSLIDGKHICMDNFHFSSISKKTGSAPLYAIADAVATNEISGQITSSPKPISQLNIAKCNAEVPLTVATAYFISIYSSIFFWNSSTYFPTDDTKVESIQSKR
jgi:glycosyltransferase domain-containing protein